MPKQRPEVEDLMGSYPQATCIKVIWEWQPITLTQFLCSRGEKKIEVMIIYNNC